MVDNVQNLDVSIAAKLAANVAGKSFDIPPPTVQLANEINALFQKDPDVFTSFCYKTGELRVLVKGLKKSEALGYLLGNVDHSNIGKFKIRVIRIREDGVEEEMPTPTHEITVEGKIDYLKAAFDGIGFKTRFSKVYVELFDYTYYFLEVEPVAISYKNDDLGNPYGYETRLAVDIVKESLDTKRILVSSLVEK